MESKETYEKLRMAHNNKWGHAALASPSSESAYRESARKMKDAYMAYAEDMKNNKTPIPRWI